MTVRWPYVVAAVAVIAVAATLAVRAQQPAPPKLQHQVASTQVRPGVAADVFLPARRAGTVPLLVLVPGGSWLSADPTGLRPLADRDVSPTFSTSFATALQKGGHRVRMVMVTGADHGSIYRPDVSAALIERWVATLSAA